MSNSRERFEAWLTGCSGVCAGATSNGIYIDPSIQEKWAAWQACEASREFVVEIPIPVHRMIYNYGKGYIDCLSKEQVIAAMEKAGGRVK